MKTIKNIIHLSIWTVWLLPHTFLGQVTFPGNGVTDIRERSYALVNCTAVSPGKTIQEAVLLIEGEKIKAIGTGLEIPGSYQVIDLKDKYVYPAFIDPYTVYGLPEVRQPERGNPVIKREQIPPLRQGAYNANDAINADYEAVRDFKIDPKAAEEWRSQGFGAVSSFRPDGVARGTSVVVSLAETGENEVVLKGNTAACFSMDKGSSRQDYPHTLMGGVSLLRQTYYDTRWYGQFQQKPFTDMTLEALLEQEDLPQLFESTDWAMSLVGDKIAREFDRDYIIKGAGDEYKRIKEIKNTGRRFIVPVNFPKPFDASDTLFTSSISLKDMKHWEMAPFNLYYLSENGVDFAITSHGMEDKKDFLPNIRKAVVSGLDRDKALAALTTVPASFLEMDDELGELKPGMYANLIVTSEDIFDFDARVSEVWVQGMVYPVDPKPSKGVLSGPDTAFTSPPKILYPFTAFGSEEIPGQEDILIRGATVWTNEGTGILDNTDVLITKGIIAGIGKDLKANNVRIIDGKGKHLTAGIIDEHSHIALKAINEMATNTSMVRMEDVINSEDIQIYRALAGGVVAAQLLHGSSDAIGGQSALVKFKWGHSPEEMLISGADKFIKFALGENPKRSKSDPSIRFPRTVMGLEEVYTNAFTNALEYQKLWQQYREKGKGKQKIKPRVDLVHEAMLEVLKSERFISCHSYLQSEMLMLMDVADRFGFKVNTFTHVLEGYKIADEMKAHGVGGSTFSDKWNFKWEARNAIPYNTVLMSGQGVITAVNSDSGEVIRHLNQEAAKSVKYGDMDEQEALKLVTLNPAKLLHLDSSMGSIKTGKSADLVLWSDYPLSVYARAEKTIIEGTVYFDLEKDEKLRDDIRKERNRLIAKMKQARDKGVATTNASSPVYVEMDCDYIDAENLLLNHK